MRERADHLWTPDLAERRRQWEDWDHGFALWVVSRNAYTLLNEPSRLFGEGPCFPFPKPLALGHPAVTQGILAAPVYAATGNPVASYNSIMILASFLAALAMYLLFRDWTGSPGAGVAADRLPDVPPPNRRLTTTELRDEIDTQLDVARSSPLAPS